jgi:4-amino-4-deoxy-L-arabinose transferase-like glycosyltransferase
VGSLFSRTKPWANGALILLVLLAVWLRAGTFGLSVINHDESTYLLIGKALWQGDTYLLDAYDTKPLGIFLIYAALYALSGGSIWLLRLAVAVVVGLTAWLLYRLSWRATGQPAVAWAAALGYLLLTSTFKFYGLSPNTELFFVPLAIAAVLLVWPHPRPWWMYGLAGLLLGLGFVIKYVIAADALALGLLLLWRAARDGDWRRSIWQRCVPMTLAFFVPFALVWGYYAQLGLLDNFLFYTFEVTSRYPVEASLGKRLLFVLEFFGRFFPFAILAILAYRERHRLDRRWQQFLLLWLTCTAVMTIVPGKTFGHYQIQMMPPLALLAASFFSSERQQGRWLRTAFAHWYRPGMLLTLILLLLVLPLSLWLYYGRKPDYPRVVMEQIQPYLGEQGHVYTGNYHHIIYHLLDQPPPTPYVHSSLLFYDHHVRALDIDLQAEAAKILNPAALPAVVLLRTEHPDNALTAAIFDRYILRDTLPDKVLLFTPK